MINELDRSLAATSTISFGDLPIFWYSGPRSLTRSTPLMFFRGNTRTVTSADFSVSSTNNKRSNSGRRALGAETTSRLAVRSGQMRMPWAGAAEPLEDGELPPPPPPPSPEGMGPPPGKETPIGGVGLWLEPPEGRAEPPDG